MVVGGKPKDAAAIAALPKWLPSAHTLKPIDEALEFIARQQRTAEQRRERRRAEQKTSAFSTLYGYHHGAGTLPADGMEGLGRGEDEERVFDPPLQVRVPVRVCACVCSCTWLAMRWTFVCRRVGV